MLTILAIIAAFVVALLVIGKAAQYFLFILAIAINLSFIWPYAFDQDMIFKVPLVTLSFALMLGAFIISSKLTDEPE